jgi:hypothetical protein
MLGAIEVVFKNAQELQIADHVFEWLDGYEYEAIVERVEQEGSEVFVYLEVDVFGEPLSMWVNWVDGFVDSAIKSGLATGKDYVETDYGF